MSPTPPHCDSLVLHAPGECRFCDCHPDWQAYRQTVGIAFSGHDPLNGQAACPSEVRRPRQLIIRWPGNVAAPDGQPVPSLYELPDGDLP